ncbi:MAG: Aspartate aminotransferase [Phycisphaerae bacterium]|nr:Aspartate aminotransferase [Phycisphaerae bacterium]
MPPFLAMEVLEQARRLEAAGRSIVHLEVGEPDFPTPAVVQEAGIRALREGHTHYTHSLGHPELRQAIAGWMQQHCGVGVSPDRVIVTLGSSAAMLLAFAALLEPGDEVLMTDPCYACYPNFVSAFGGRSVRIPVSERDAFQYDVDAVLARFTARSRVLLLNSPANPTGTLTTPERMRALIEAAGGRVTIVSDEIYHGLTYAERAHSILEFEPDAVVVNGFSKLFAMTGWRLGYLIVPEWLVRPIQKLQQNLFISAPDFTQFAAVAALQHAAADVEHMRRCYDERRRLVLRRLAEIGLPVLCEPAGAFYAFVNVRRLTDDVLAFSREMLEHAGVAVTPGVDFGPGGAGYVRVSYANSLEQIGIGLHRIAAFVAQRGVPQA